jgi:hypothetical protein
LFVCLFISGNLLLIYLSTERNQLESSFLRLPAELRNGIYDLVFELGTYEIDSDADCAALPLLCHPKASLGLLFTCRQVNAETMILPYKQNMFSFSTLQDIPRFLDERTPAQERAIEVIELWTDCISYTTIVTIKSLDFLASMDGLERIYLFPNHGKSSDHDLE